MELLHWLLPIAGGVLVGASAPWPAKALWGWIRGSQASQLAREANELQRLAAQLEDALDLVDLLRKALDKHMIRWGAVASACELLIALVRMIDKPTPAMRDMKEQARRLLDDARAHLTSINNKGGEA